MRQGERDKRHCLPCLLSLNPCLYFTNIILLLTAPIGVLSR